MAARDLLLDRRMRRRCAVLAIAAVALAVGSGPGRAHSGNAAFEGAPRGLEIPAVTHGEMATIDAFRPRIVALADRAVATDERFRRLKNHGALQYAYCLWGLVPGAVTNEGSPFNACSHAYLASSWSLLRHMATMPQVKEEALRLSGEIEAALARTPETLCVASADVFNTAVIVKPAWARTGWAWGAAGASAVLMAAAGLYTARAAGARAGT